MNDISRRELIKAAADASGRTLARRSYAGGEGLVMADIELNSLAASEEIPADASRTPDVAAQAQMSWARSGAAGRGVYINSTRPRRNGSIAQERS